MPEQTDALESDLKPGLDQDYRFKLQKYKTCKMNELEGRNNLIYKQLKCPINRSVKI